jgi:hypothetical protein
MRPCSIRSARSERFSAGEGQALQLFEWIDQQRFIAVLSEVAAAGQGGLQINEPGTARTLKNLPGSWSDLALACLIHVGMKGCWVFTGNPERRAYPRQRLG